MHRRTIRRVLFSLLALSALAAGASEKVCDMEKLAPQWYSFPRGKLKAVTAQEKYKGRTALLFDMPEPSGHIDLKLPIPKGESLDGLSFAIRMLPGCTQKEVLFVLSDNSDGETWYYSVKHRPEWKEYTVKLRDFRLLTWPGKVIADGKLSRDSVTHLQLYNSPKGQKFLLADLKFRFSPSGPSDSAAPAEEKKQSAGYKIIPIRLPAKTERCDRFFPEAWDTKVSGTNFVRSGRPVFLLGAWQLDVETAPWLMRLCGVDVSIFNAAEIYTLYTPWRDKNDGKLVLHWKDNPWYEGIIARLLRNKIRFWHEHKASPRSGELPKFREFDEIRDAGHFVAYDPYHPDGERCYQEMYKSWMRHTRKFPIFCYELFNEMMYDNTHPISRKAFADSMRKKYHGDLSRANRAWGTSFRSFDEVNPPGFLQDGGRLNLPRESLFRRESLRHPNLTVDWRKFQEQRGGDAIEHYMKLMRRYDPDPHVLSTTQCHLSLPDDYGSAGLSPESVRRGSDFYSHEVGVPYVESMGYMSYAFAATMLKPLFSFDMLYHSGATGMPIMNAESGMHVSTRGASESDVRQQTLLDLHSGWKFFDATRATPPDWWTPGFDDRSWGGIKVPAMWAESGYKLCQVGLYRKTFPLPKEAPRTGRLYLNGKSFADKADIYLNGEKLGSVKGHSESWTFDVTGKLRETNVLAAIIENRYFHGGSYYGGIRGFVTLNTIPLVLPEERRPGMKTGVRDRRHVRSFLWSQAVHGMRGVMVSYEDAFYTPESRILPQLRASILSVMPFLSDRNTSPKAQVAVIWNQETLRSIGHRDYVEQVSGPATRDFMNYYGNLLFGFHEPLVLRNCDLMKKIPDVKVIVMGDNLRIPGALLPKLREYVSRGGVLIVNYETLCIDDDFHGRLDPSPLTGTRTLSRESKLRKTSVDGIGQVLLDQRFVDKTSRAVLQSAGAEVLARFADGHPALLRNRIGKGCVYTLAGNFDPASTRKLFDRILNESKVIAHQRLLPVGNEPPPPYVDGKIFTDREGRTLIYLQNYGNTGKVRLPVAFRGRAQVRNVDRNIIFKSLSGNDLWTEKELAEGIPLVLEQYNPVVLLIEPEQSRKMVLKGISPIRHAMLSELWRKPPEKPGCPTVGITPVYGGLIKVHGVIPTARKLLTDNGFNVRELQIGDPLDGIDVLFYQSLRTPCDPAYAKTILDFVRKGGSLLIGHSAELNHHTSSHSRALTVPLGLDHAGLRRNVLYNWNPRFPDEDNLNVECRDFTDHPAARFVRTFVSAGAGCLNRLPPNGRAILNSPADSTLKGRPMIAEIPFGRGRVIFMSDHWFLRPFMLEQGDNAQLFYNLICHLAGREIVKLTPAQLENALFINRRKMAEAEEQEKRDPGICTPIPSSATYLDFGKERIHVMGHGDPVIDILRQF